MHAWQKPSSRLEWREGQWLEKGPRQLAGPRETVLLTVGASGVCKRPWWILYKVEMRFGSGGWEWRPENIESL